jgi:hypothetical protein
MAGKGTRGGGAGGKVKGAGARSSKRVRVRSAGRTGKAGHSRCAGVRELGEVGGVQDGVHAEGCEREEDEGLQAG